MLQKIQFSQNTKKLKSLYENRKSNALQFHNRQQSDQVENIYHNFLKRPQTSRQNSHKQLYRFSYNNNPLETHIFNVVPCKRQIGQQSNKTKNLQYKTTSQEIFFKPKEKTLEVTLQQKYKIEAKLDKGTFGTVYLAKSANTNELVAYKKVQIDKRYKNRQIQMMEKLSHPNIVKLIQAFLSSQENKDYINIIMEYYPTNLYNLIKNNKINQKHVKVYAFQLLHALNYLNSLRIAHRDIKPHNILINKNKLVLCDFGSAKQLGPNEKSLAYICSRSYRAPELIFEATIYDGQIDIWSIGCIILEMIHGCVAFMAPSQKQLLYKIITFLGTPTINDMYDMNPNYNQAEYMSLPKVKGKQLSNTVKTKDYQLIDLLSKILVYSPKKRLTAAQALNHSYFNQLKNPVALDKIVKEIGVLPNIPQFSIDKKIIELGKHKDSFDNNVLQCNKTNRSTKTGFQQYTPKNSLYYKNYERLKTFQH